MRLARLIAALCLLFAYPRQGAWAQAGAPSAVWKEQHLHFVYAGRTSRYSCEGLRDKVRAMLVVLGARRDLALIAQDCEGVAENARRGASGPSLSIVVSTPVPVAAGLRPLHAGDLAGVNARYEPFVITNDAFRNMSAADCELVEEFARQILPKLATRNLTQNVACVPMQAGEGRYLLRGEVLRAL